MIYTKAVTVSTTATLLYSPSWGTGLHGPQPALYNAGANTIYIGDANVDTTDGFPITAGTYFGGGDLFKNEDLYGIVAAATESMHVFVSGSAEAAA